ncbi:hypothetical protein TrVFT333_009786 [Trichoderma virens FT-333]|nr:hypothetical protein TrVFT333_009786 [Trichoderma virens FT-333]
MKQKVDQGQEVEITSHSPLSWQKPKVQDTLRPPKRQGGKSPLFKPTQETIVNAVGGGVESGVIMYSSGDEKISWTLVQSSSLGVYQKVVSRNELQEEEKPTGRKRKIWVDVRPWR